MIRHMSMYVSNAQVPHRADSRAGHRVLVALGIVGVMALSFLIATWQHVEALRYGYRLNQLVRERERLEALKRQLELERAYHRSPQVIEPLARRLGLIRPDPSQVIVVGRGAASSEGDAHRTEPPEEARMPRASHSEIEARQIPASAAARSEGSRAIRRRLRATPIRSESESPRGGVTEPHAGSATASENPEALPMKGAKPSDGVSSQEGSGEMAPPSADPLPKRRRPSKQGEP
jgi:cell division protein FtsL